MCTHCEHTPLFHRYLQLASISTRYLSSRQVTHNSGHHFLSSHFPYLSYFSGVRFPTHFGGIWSSCSRLGLTGIFPLVGPPGEKHYSLEPFDHRVVRLLALHFRRLSCDTNDLLLLFFSSSLPACRGEWRRIRSTFPGA
jgi:hypothetical protein